MACCKRSMPKRRQDGGSCDFGGRPFERDLTGRVLTGQRCNHKDGLDVDYTFHLPNSERPRRLTCCARGDVRFAVNLGMREPWPTRLEVPGH